LYTAPCTEIAQEILSCCLRGIPWPPELLRQLVDRASGPDQEDALAASRALFGVLAEGMADLFEPRLCASYAAILSYAIASATPGSTAAELLERYGRVRQVHRFDGDAGAVRNVFVLSRVTLGADIAVTSAVLDAAKRRFRSARVFLVGGAKSAELFAADPGARHIPISYGRGGTLRERLAIWPALRAACSHPGSLVIDPDSRLTQLGLLPVCADHDYYFFESRSYGGDGEDSLTFLVRRWLEQTLGVPDATPYIAPAEKIDPGEGPVVTISLGVGENPAKRIPDPFEEDLLRALGRKKAILLIDKGAGEEEAERVERAIERSGVDRARVRTWEGSFATFAGMIARSSLYIGYDSAGQHAAAATGTPLVSIFAGYPSHRMLCRWQPTGSGPIEVIRAENRDPADVLDRTLAAVERLRVI
jgi:ADP-heptose:LPS heptosyltransferase